MSVSATLHDKNQPKEFSFSKENLSKVDEIIARYPQGRERSAVMPLLFLAQKQVGEQGPHPKENGGAWLPRVAMDEVARILDLPPIKVYEVATFYTMYNKNPVGKHHVQVCTTTPCMLSGSDDVVSACKNKLGIDFGETTDDGMFTLSEVECLGACVNAPMIQINDDYYEDLTAERTEKVLDALAKGKKPPIGPQSDRKSSYALTGPTVLKDMVDGDVKAKTKTATKKKKTSPKKGGKK